MIVKEEIPWRQRRGLQSHSSPPFLKNIMIMKKYLAGALYWIFNILIFLTRTKIVSNLPICSHTLDHQKYSFSAFVIITAQT